MAELMSKQIQIQSGDQYCLNNTVSMLFGPQFIPPPLIYMYYLPNIQQWPQPIVKSQPTEENIYHSMGNDHSRQLAHSHLLAEPKRIIVTKQDLLEEGYEKSKRAWTEEEDQILLKLCSNSKALFEEIAPFLPGRNAKMCYSRYRRLTNQSKEPWTKSDNQLLKSLVQQFGESWKDFLKHFPNRNHKQLKDHYENYLEPSIDSSEWTLDQDLELIRLINQHGQNWKYLQTLMPNRSRSQLKNRFFGRIRRMNARKLQNCEKACIKTQISLAY